jgi:hypothetical protein
MGTVEANGLIGRWRTTWRATRHNGTEDRKLFEEMVSRMSPGILPIALRWMLSGVVPPPAEVSTAIRFVNR